MKSGDAAHADASWRTLRSLFCALGRSRWSIGVVMRMAKEPNKRRPASGCGRRH